MRNLTSEAIKDLLSQSPTIPAVTLYLPTHRTSAPPHMNEDQIRLKNLSRKAMDMMKSRNDSGEFMVEFENQIDLLLSDREFWMHQTEGLMVSVSPGTMQSYHLPLYCDEYVAVDTHYHLFPVYGLLSENQSFHVLSVSLHGPAIYKGDQYSLNRSDIEMPKDLVSALNIDEFSERNLRFHAIRGGNGAQYHGHGGSKDPNDADRLHFFRIIDHIVMTRTDTTLPLILAGTQNELTEYRSISKHPRILEGYIHGRLNGNISHEQQAAAWNVVYQEVIEPKKHAALDSFRQLEGASPERTATNIDDIRKAADSGRVSQLILGLAQSSMDGDGNNKEPVSKIIFPDQKSSRDYDYITEQTWTQSGTIINVDEPQMNGKMAAILRY